MRLTRVKKLYLSTLRHDILLQSGANWLSLLTYGGDSPLSVGVFYGDNAFARHIHSSVYHRTAQRWKWWQMPQRVFLNKYAPIRRRKT